MTDATEICEDAYSAAIRKFMEEWGAFGPEAAFRHGLQRYLDRASKLPTRPGADAQFDDVPGYSDLAGILKQAYDQSARGKGRKRHSNGLPFRDQPIFNISRMVGLGGLTYQICKKAQEATTMGRTGAVEAAKAELLGCIVYAAAAVLLITESSPEGTDP